MLVRIYASNFLSFKDKVEFSFVCNDTSNQDTFFLVKKKYQKKEKEYAINKVSAIYWANASWKTNVLKIIKFIKEMILYSHDQNFSLSLLWYRPFLLSNKIKDSEFWVDFFIWDILYSYSFKVNLLSSKILEETLLEYQSQKATALYKRKWQKFSINEKFSEWKERKQFVRENSLALSVFSNMSWEKSTYIWKFFRDKIHFFHLLNNINGWHFGMTDTINMIDLYSEEFSPFLQNLLVSADININRMDSKFEELPINEMHWMPNMVPQNNKIKVFTNTFNHSIYDDKWNKTWDINFNPDWESTWTNTLVGLSGSFYNVLKNGMALFIDELDSSLHPLLVKEIVAKFNSYSNSNWWQLIFSTHDVSLLDDNDTLPKNQTWFVDKNKKWESSLYSLDDFNWINNMSNISKAYLLWRFDGIPHVWKI